MSNINLDNCPPCRIELMPLLGDVPGKIKMGSIVSPGFHYQATFAILNEIIKSLQRAGQEMMQQLMLKIGDSFKINDNHINSIKHKNFHSFASVYLIDRIMPNDSGKKGARRINEHLNLFRTDTRLTYVYDVLSYIQDKNEFTIKLKNAVDMVCFHIVVLIHASYEKVSIWKPEDDIWLMDSFYVTAQNPRSTNAIKMILEKLLIYNHRQDMSTYIDGFLRYDLIDNTPLWKEWNKFAGELTDKILPLALQVMTILQS